MQQCSGPGVRPGGGLQPPDSGKPIIFRANVKFFGQMPAAKSDKNYFIYRYLLNENGIHFVQRDDRSARNSGFLPRDALYCKAR